MLKILKVITRAAVSEWLRSWTRNPMGYARTGSNPVVCDIFWQNIIRKPIVRRYINGFVKYIKFIRF